MPGNLAALIWEMINFIFHSNELTQFLTWHTNRKEKPERLLSRVRSPDFENPSHG